MPKQKRTKREPIAVTTTVGDAVSTCFSELEELGSEMREVCDNTPENLQGSDLYSRRETAADALESISEPDVPSDLQDVPVAFTVMPSRRSSRAQRCSDATRYATEAIEALNAYAEEHPSGADTIEGVVDEIKSMVDEAEGVEFPGMFG